MASMINEVTKEVARRLFSEAGVERRRQFENKGMALMQDSYNSYEEFESDMYRQISVVGKLYGIDIDVPDNAPITLKRALFDTQVSMTLVENEEAFLQMANGLLNTVIIMYNLELDEAEDYKKFVDDRIFNPLVILLSAYYPNIAEIGTSYQNLVLMTTVVLTTVNFN